jgi:G3E family GTPase
MPPKIAKVAKRSCSEKSHPVHSMCIATIVHVWRTRRSQYAASRGRTIALSKSRQHRRFFDEYPDRIRVQAVGTPLAQRQLAARAAEDPLRARVYEPMGKIPTTLLTGFLGSGKTTLLNHILSHQDKRRVAVIVNEFGEVGIDGQLVIGVEEEILELNNGCICCTVRGDLARAVGSLLASGRTIDHILIETTGLADPAPVIQSFILDETLRSSTELDAIVTVVDAQHVVEQLHNEQACEQVAFADVILINKIDLVSERSVQDLARLLRSLNPLAKIHRTSGCDIDLGHVVGVHAFDLRNALKLDPELLTDGTHKHDSDISCVSIRERGAVNATLFTRWLNQLVQSQGRDLLRIKGIIDLEGESRRFVFHGVHMTLDGRPGSPWKREQPRSNELVFIGRNLDAAALRTGFRECASVSAAVSS